MLAVLVLLAFNPQFSKALAQSVQPIYSFPARTQANLVAGPDGNLYGTTLGNGTVFKVTTDGVVTTLASFIYTNGVAPYGVGLYASPVLGPDGNFYGTTYAGGSTGCGVVYKVTTNGLLTAMASFAITNGAFPYASVALGPDGNFYGTTYQGGSWGDGVVYKLTTNGQLTAVVSFAGTNGANPYAGLALGSDGNFYGTTFKGGSWDEGVAFRVTTDGLLTILGNFGPRTNGANPRAVLTPGPDGYLYGTTSNSGTAGYGSIFRVSTNGEFASLASFTGLNGESPDGSLAVGPDGNFYGTTESGGGSDEGTVFQMTTNGLLTTLVSFAYTNGVYPFGANPYAGLTLAADGNFYGTTQNGGSNGLGVIYRLNLPPKIIQQPASQFPIIGTDVNFSVTLFGTAPYSFQWLSNNIPIEGGTNGTLTIPNVISADAGSYSVIVSNAWGSITSSAASLSVFVQPNISGISNNVSSGSTTLYLASYPDSTNCLYATTNLALPFAQWQLIATSTADSNGLFEVVDTNTNRPPAKFYRIQTSW